MSDFERVKQRVSMEDLLAHYGWEYDTFGRGGWGGWVNILCPFHDDHTSSARYNPLKDRFQCFACDYSGDIFDVVQQVEGFTDVREAKEWIESNFRL